MKKQISQCHTVTEVLGLESEITNHRFLPICPPRDHATVDPWEFGKPFGSFKVLHVHVGLVILTIHVSRRAAITTFLQRTRTYKSALCLLSSPLFRHYFEHFAFCLGSPAPRQAMSHIPACPSQCIPTASCWWTRRHHVLKMLHTAAASGSTTGTTPSLQMCHTPLHALTRTQHTNGMAREGGSNRKC